MPNNTLQITSSPADPQGLKRTEDVVHNRAQVVSAEAASIPLNHESNSSSNPSGTDPKMEYLYHYAVKHGFDPEKILIITETEKKRCTNACFCGNLKRDLGFYRGKRRS